MGLDNKYFVNLPELTNGEVNWKLFICFRTFYIDLKLQNIDLKEQMENPTT